MPEDVVLCWLFNGESVKFRDEHQRNEVLGGHVTI